MIKTIGAVLALLFLLEVAGCAWLVWRAEVPSSDTKDEQ